MTNLICIGACYLDTILSVPYFPEEDSKLRATSLTIRRGGNGANSLEVLQQLLARCPNHDVTPYLMSCLPEAGSPATGIIKDSFGPNSIVDLTRCIYREEHMDPASSYIIRSAATGSRTLVSYNDLPDMTASEFLDAAKGIGGKTWWHFEGRIPDTTSRCIQHLRQVLPQAKISIEIEKPGREGLEELATEADVVFYSKGWAESKGYHTARDFLTAQSRVVRRASLLLCTWGSEGASSLSLPSQCYLSYSASLPEQVIRVVDTIGAGDTFIAGILFGLLCHQEDWDVATKLKFAVELATCKVQQEGFGGVGLRAMKHYFVC